MKEIYLLNKGDSIQKVQYEYGQKDYIKQFDKDFNFNYVTLQEGSNDIIVVRNYFPCYLYRAKKGDTAIEIMSKGFEVADAEISENSLVVMKKPSNIKHIVKPLETIEKISKIYGISVQNIFDKNSLKTDKLFVGQILWL